MAIVYRVVFDIDKYEEEVHDLSEEMYKKYKNPLYIESLYRASFIRSYYGEKYVQVSQCPPDIEWTPVDWSTISGMKETR